MKLFKVKLISALLLGVGFVLLLIGEWLNSEILPVFVLSGLLIFVGDCIFIFFCWRCPVCNAHLPTSGLVFMSSCPYCGNDLD